MLGPRLDRSNAGARDCVKGANTNIVLVASFVVATVGLSGLASAQPAEVDPQMVTATDAWPMLQASAAGIGGPSAVPDQIRQTDQAEQRPGPAWPTLPSLERYGLELGADYQLLYQHASDTLGEDSGFGGVARFYGHWSPGHPSEGDVAQLVFKIENRRRLGSGVSPQGLASEIGAAGLSAVTFSDAGNVLTNLYWTQTFGANRIAMAAGIVDTTDYIDVYGLVNPWTDFNNLAFTTNPTIPAPNQGIGGMLRWAIGSNYYLHGGIADANGDPTDTGDSLSSFFDTREYFKHLEFGWVASYDDRFTDNAHIIAWEADDREEAGIEGGWGVALSFSRLVKERWNPFIRAGYADRGGALFDRLVSAGLGYQREARHDYVGLAASWGRPPVDQTGGRAEDQYTIEAFYRVEFFKHLQITPSIQYIADPVFHPSAQGIWITSVRARAAF